MNIQYINYQKSSLRKFIKNKKLKLESNIKKFNIIWDSIKLLIANESLQKFFLQIEPIPKLNILFYNTSFPWSSYGCFARFIN